MWFEELTGFTEESPQQVRRNITVDGNRLRSLINGKEFVCGELKISSLAELREQVRSSNYRVGQISVREIVANVQDLHLDEANAGALFQVASQFNLLEMVSPSVTPERGVGIYEHDRTQGPACAIAAGAGTIYRNYFVNVNGSIGQTESNQVDCLADIGLTLGNYENNLWEMKNGYALASQSGLIQIGQQLKMADEDKLDQLRQLLRIGIQCDAQVTLNDSKHLVSQAYCSALPVAYSHYPSNYWEEFARLVLEASYEATICTAILNSIKTDNNRVFLTLLGGGVFGNQIEWIIDAIKRAMNIYADADLDVAIVSYGSSNPYVQDIITTEA